MFDLYVSWIRNGIYKRSMQEEIVCVLNCNLTIQPEFRELINFQMKANIFLKNFPLHLSQVEDLTQRKFGGRFCWDPEQNKRQ